MTSFITERITKITETLPASVRLIAVTKQVSVTAIRAAYAAGIRDFGESKVAETALKQAELQDLANITWHLIGHLQSNKAEKALLMFKWIHSLDSLKLAQRLNRLAALSSLSPQVLQVKMLPDPDKYGWTVPELLANLPALNDCGNLQIQGLMTIPPIGLDEEEILTVFQKTRELAAQINQENYPNIKMQHLSMGMSQDYHLAIQAGATYIRLGTTLFGERAI